MSAPASDATRAALRRAVDGLPAADPLAGAALRIARQLGVPTRSSHELFEQWQSRAPGSPRSEMRYRWELSHRRGVPLPRWAPDVARWKAWKPAELPQLEKDPFAFEERLLLPITLSENCELLADSSAGGDALSRALYLEALPAARRDFAGFIQALDPWRDTFALWCLVRRERCLADLHPLAVAIATTYAALSSEGTVVGIRFPFHEQVLVSATAQLAMALFTLGSELELVAEAVGCVMQARHEDGGWGDGSGPSDVLTSLVAADLCARVDPSFDFAPTARWLASAAGPDGLFSALGPDAPWLTAEWLGLADAASRPFGDRFRWPYLPRANLDRKTGLPFFAYFADLARLFGALGGLSRCTLELAFVDLVGFRAFNNSFGQDRGDDVLREVARALDELEGLRAIRDGGDEFILVGAPDRTGLGETLDRFRKTWPERFAATFGRDLPPVAPRILAGKTRGRSLLAAREELGRGITSLKGVAIGAEGLLVGAGEIG